MALKKLTCCILGIWLSACVSLAQIPAGYYDSAINLTGKKLKKALHIIIRNNEVIPFTSKKTDSWDILKKTDKDALNPGNVILFYSGWRVNGAQEFNNGKGWNREHVWALSHGKFDTDMIPGLDLHNIKPADISVNSARGNKDFDDGGKIYIDDDSPTQCRTDNDSWEPADNVKGDVARILFYMATRYEGENGEPDLELADNVNTHKINQPGKGFHGKLSTLCQWHNADPVDDFERNRNNIIYSVQKNRNPFIDHPEFVQKIWCRTQINRIIPWLK